VSGAFLVVVGSQTAHQLYAVEVVNHGWFASLLLLLNGSAVAVSHRHALALAHASEDGKRKGRGMSLLQNSTRDHRFHAMA
jgi:hypothetical protein